MAQTGYTPIILFHSTTASAVPTTSNLAVGELGLNNTDGKLYYNTGSAIAVLAGAGGAGIAGGSNTQVQYNSSGSLAGSANLTFNGTNLGLGITPNAAWSSFSAIQLGGNTYNAIASSNSYMGVFANTYYDGTNFKYVSTAGASTYTQNGGAHYWSVASSGTAGNNITFTQAMTLNGSGQLSTTSDASISGLTVGKGASSVAGNTVVGSSALASNITGDNSVAIGFLSLNSNTTGTSNSALGLYSLRLNTTGSYNSAFGQQALYSNTTGSNNTAVGYQALYTQSGGTNRNTALGQQAGYSATNGQECTFIGYQAGYAVTSGGGDNTFVGGYAGSAVTSGYANTILGKYTGNQGGLDIRTANNYIVLSDGAGNPNAYCDSNKSWVLNSATSSGNTLSVKSTNAGTGMYVASGSFATGTAYFHYFIYNGSAVGQITSTGSVTLFTSLSDQRLKENIVDAGSGLAKLANVKVRSFDWKTNQEKTDFGLVAQELNDVAPEAVVAGIDKEDGSIDKPWQIDSSALVPAMIKAIQELKAEVDSLKAQLGK